jgi:hypothetical protein
MSLYAAHEVRHDIWERVMDHVECDCKYCVALEVLEEYLS